MLHSRLELARPSPPNALEAAATFGVDMSAHRSNFADPEAVESAYLIFVFDRKIYQSFLDRYPMHQSKVHLFTHIDAALDAKDIEDPYGFNLDTFIDTYKTINTYTLQLMQKLKIN